MLRAGAARRPHDFDKRRSPNDRACIPRRHAARLSEDRRARRGRAAAGRRAARVGSEPDAQRQQGARFPDFGRRRQSRAGRRDRLLRPRRRAGHRHLARRVPEGLPEDQDQLREAADRRALRQDHRRAVGVSLRRRRAPALGHHAGHRLPEEGRLGAVHVARVRRVQAGISVDPGGLLRPAGRQLLRHLLQPHQGQTRAGAEDVEGHQQPGLQGRDQRQARDLGHAARALVHPAQDVRQRLLAGIRQAAAEGLRRARPALRPARQGRGPRLRARRVRGLHALPGQGRRDRVRRAARRDAGDRDLHRCRQQGATPGRGEALRRLGALQARPARLSEPEDPPLRLAAARRGADAHGQTPGRLQTALPHGLDRLRGEPPGVRERVELDHGLVSARDRGAPRVPRGVTSVRGAWWALRSPHVTVSVLVGGLAAVLVLYPIAYLVQASLSVGDPQARPPEAYGLDNYAGLGRYAHIFGNTLLVAALATALAVVVGFTMGWILSRTNVPGRAGRARAMLRITLPLVLPGVLGAAVFVFAEMLGSFSAALVLGLPNRFYVATTAMYQLVSQYPPRFPTAAAMGVSLFAVMFAMVWIYRRIVSAGTYVTITGKAFRPRAMDVGSLRWPFLGVCVAYLTVAVILPVLTVTYASLQHLTSAFPRAANFTLVNYQTALALDAVRSALGNSLLLGLATASVGVLLMGFLSWLIYRSRLPGAGVIEYLVMFPQAVPRLVFAFGMLWAWLIFPIPIYGTLWLLLIAYLTVFLPLGLRTISGVILQIDRSLEESAQMCGATWGYRLRTVTMPLLKPGLSAAWLLLFIASVRELGASILLMGPKAKVITPAIVESWFSTSTELTAAMALLQTLAVVAALVLLFAVARRAVQQGGE